MKDNYITFEYVKYELVAYNIFVFTGRKFHFGYIIFEENTFIFFSVGQISVLLYKLG